MQSALPSLEAIPSQPESQHIKVAPSWPQDELHMTKEGFKDRFGDDPRKDDLTILAPKQDDPTEQVLCSKGSITYILQRCSLFCQQAGPTTEET